MRAQAAYRAKAAAKMSLTAGSPLGVGRAAARRVMGYAHNQTEQKPMKTLKTALIAALTLTSLTALPAVAQGTMAQDKYLNDRLVAARVADRIRRECPSIDLRIVSAYSQARALQRYARDLGNSDAQVDAYLDDETVKKRIYGIAETYLAQQGAKAGDAESFCRVGRDEIAKNTVSGSLLNAK